MSYSYKCYSDTKDFMKDVYKRQVDELLQNMAEGKTLDDAEMEYVKIFANLKDFEKAQQKAELKNDFSEDFVKDLELSLIHILLRSALSGSSHRGMDRNVKMYPDYTGYVFPESGLL